MDKVIREGAIRVGVDLAKRVIQVHAVDHSGKPGGLGSLGMLGESGRLIGDIGTARTSVWCRRGSRRLEPIAVEGLLVLGPTHAADPLLAADDPLAEQVFHRPRCS